MYKNSYVFVCAHSLLVVPGRVGGATVTYVNSWSCPSNRFFMRLQYASPYE